VEFVVFLAEKLAEDFILTWSLSEGLDLIEPNIIIKVTNNADKKQNRKKEIIRYTSIEFS
jgi:hypothetical protein